MKLTELNAWFRKDPKRWDALSPEMQRKLAKYSPLLPKPKTNLSHIEILKAKRGGNTAASIAKQLGVSRQHISQVLDKPIRMTGSQVRAARAVLDWTVADLAKVSNVDISTIESIEQGKSGIRKNRFTYSIEHQVYARQEALLKIMAALGNAGIVFQPKTDAGVGIRWREK